MPALLRQDVEATMTAHARVSPKRGLPECPWYCPPHALSHNCCDAISRHKHMPEHNQECIAFTALALSALPAIEEVTASRRAPPHDLSEYLGNLAFAEVACSQTDKIQIALPTEAAAVLRGYAKPDASQSNRRINLNPQPIEPFLATAVQSKFTAESDVERSGVLRVKLLLFHTLVCRLLMADAAGMAADLQQQIDAFCAAGDVAMAAKYALAAQRVCVNAKGAMLLLCGCVVKSAGSKPHPLVADTAARRSGASLLGSSIYIRRR